MLKWILKNKASDYILLSVICYIFSELLLYTYHAPTIIKCIIDICSTLSGGFFIGLLIYFLTITIPERKKSEYILKFLLKSLKDLKEEILPQFVHLKMPSYYSELTTNQKYAHDYFKDNKATLLEQIEDKGNRDTILIISGYFTTYANILNCFLDADIIFSSKLTRFFAEEIRSINQMDSLIKQNSDSGKQLLWENIIQIYSGQPIEGSQKDPTENELQKALDNL